MNNIPSHEHFADIILAEKNNLILIKYSISIIFLVLDLWYYILQYKNEPGIHFQELFCTMKYVIFM